MAKDLPYFKFFVSEWSDGDITLESYEVQGVFINVCSYYWSNGCDVSYSKLIKKFKDCTDSVDVLENEGIIKIEGEMVFINFLDEQLGDRKQTSDNNSKAGKISAEKRRLAKIEQEANKDSTGVEIPLNTNPTIKKRGEERRGEDNNNTPTKVDGFDWVNLLKTINLAFGREFRTINDTVKAKYNARLKDGYTKDDVKNAINNCKNDSFHKDKNYKHCTPEYFSRSATLDLHSQVTVSNNPKSINPHSFNPVN